VANIMTGKPVRGAWAKLVAGIALTVVSASVVVTTAQDKVAQPQRAREIFSDALKNYKAGEYESAAEKFSQAISLQNQLTTAERNDLKSFIQKNNDALTAQRDGHSQVQRAEDALRHGKTADASGLVKSLNSNQYLAAADRQALAKLNQSLRLPATGQEQPVENTEKALLAAAREALHRGNLELAEAYNAQAKKVAPFMHLPGADTPTKVEREIAAARTKMTVASDKKDNGVVKTVSKLWNKDEKKEVTVIGEGPTLVKESGTGQSPPFRQTTQDAAANKALARKLVKEGYQAL